MLLQILACIYPFYFLILLGLLLIMFVRSFPIFKRLPVSIYSRDYFLLFLLMMLGLILRIKYTYHIDLDPYGWRYIQNALAINNIFCPFSGLSFRISDALHIPGYPVLISLPLLFSKSLLGISIFNVCFGVLTIWLIYLISYFLTEDKVSSVLAAGFLAFSQLHIVYSGQEFPMPISVFFVALEFLYLVLWLKSKDTAAGLVFALAFLISLNIKIENIIFLPLFVGITLKERKYHFWREKGNFKKHLRFIIALLFSAIVFCPFIIKLYQTQLSTLKRFGNANEFFSLNNFIRHFVYFILQKSCGFPLFMILAYSMLHLFKRCMSKGYILLGWSVFSFIYFFWYADIFSEWNMQQVLIPIYIISGYVISKTINLFFRNKYLGGAILFLFLFLWLGNSVFKLNENKRFKRLSWITIRHDLKTISENECIVCLDKRTSKFSMTFLFPDKNWIFLNDAFTLGQLDKCRGNLYYFDVIPWGLEEEVDKNEVLLWENLLRGGYEFKKTHKLALYELRKK
mgnify:CR=1 FL=1